MRRAVITGSRGFIGRHLIAHLRGAGWSVLGVGSTHGPADGPRGSRYHAWDGQSPDEILPADWGHGPFTLIDLAWDTARPVHYSPHALQVARLARLLDALPARGLEAVVGVGSAEEYGRRDGILREDDPPVGALSAYGWGKATGASLLRNWSGATGIPARWLRPFLAYGPGQNGNMAVPYALRQALGGRPAAFSDGTQLRDFVHVADVVGALAAAAGSALPGFEAFNVGTGVPTAVRDVLAAIADGLGAGERFRFGAVPRRPGEPEVQVADVTRAERLLGWQARVSWRDGIRDLIHRARAERWAA